MLFESEMKPPPTALGLLRFWKNARGPHVLPHRSAIDPIHLREWLSNLSILEMRHGAKRYFVRFHGMETIENLGQDFSRQYLEDCTSGAATELAIYPYKASIAALMPTFSTFESARVTGAFNSLDRLVLPFTDVDQNAPDAPVSVDRFLAWVGPTDRMRGEQSEVYRTNLSLEPSGTNGNTRSPFRLAVIDVDDPRYGLDDSNHSSVPFAAQRPEAKHI